MAYAGTISFADGTIVHQWMMSESSGELAQMCRDRGIDSSCQAKAESRKQELLGERLLMHTIFGIHTPILHNGDRAPYIENSQVHLSVAHTKGCLVIALNEHHRIGVDVERYSQQVMKVRTAFLNEAEQQWLPASDHLAHIVAWTAKEAIFKSIGERRLVESTRNDIMLYPFPTPAMGGTISHGACFKSADYALHTILSPTHVLTFCHKK